MLVVTLCRLSSKLIVACRQDGVCDIVEVQK